MENRRQAYSALPILANGKAYVTRKNGTTFVIAAMEKVDDFAQNTLGEFTVATPVFIDGQIPIRTIENLYFIGAGK